jgi:uncharacterized membrane protein YdjX (TVP38/TMEM64 family)
MTMRRVVAMALVAALLVGMALTLGGVVHIDPASLAARVQGAGALGVVIFLALFAASAVFNIPAVVFVAAAVAVYGRWGGFAVALVGAVLSVNITFALGRWTRLGQGRWLERPWLARAMRWLESRPILAMIALRALVVVSPPLNYALALTRLSHRDFAVGSALGLLAPLFVLTGGLQCLLG